VQLKDLKRQLQAERKRGDKLQEKLQEMLSESARGRQCKLLALYLTASPLIHSTRVPPC